MDLVKFGQFWKHPISCCIMLRVPLEFLLEELADISRSFEAENKHFQTVKNGPKLTPNHGL